MGRQRKTRRANGEGTISLLANGRWRAEITLPATPNGKRRRKSKTCQSQADAVEALRELHNEQDTGSEEAPEDMTISAWLDARHTIFKAGDWAASTVNDRGTLIELHLTPYIGDVLLSKMTAAHVESLLTKWDDNVVGMRTREKAFRLLKKDVEVARSRGHLRCDPFHGITPPRSRRTNIDPYTADEMHAILKAAKGDRLEAFWWLALGTGMRLGEMAAISPRCVDLKSGVLRVERTAKYSKKRVVLKAPKTERSRRTIELPSKVLAMLKSHAARTMKAGKAGGEFFFPDRDGGMLRSENILRRSWWPILKKANVPVRKIHQTRHTYATVQLLAGVPVHVVSAVLGHASPSITLDIYSHYVKSHQVLAREAMDRTLKAGG